MTHPPGDRPPTPAPPPTQQQRPPAGDASLQFDRADFGAGTDTGTAEQQPAAVTTCSACQERLTGQYYAAPGEIVVCPPCRDQIMASMTGGSGARRFFRALLFGVVVGALGALLWWGIRRATSADWGIVAVAVGFAVGAAVRKGSEDRGGLSYQFLALLLTYGCIGLSFIPDALAEGSGDMEPLMIPFVVVFTLIVGPIFVGFHSIIGALIFAFALWEAWRINKYRPMEFAGPFTIAGGTGAGGMPPAPVQPPSSTEPPPPPPPSTPPPQLGMT